MPTTTKCVVTVSFHSGKIDTGCCFVIATIVERNGAGKGDLHVNYFAIANRDFVTTSLLWTGEKAGRRLHFSESLFAFIAANEPSFAFLKEAFEIEGAVHQWNL